MERPILVNNNGTYILWHLKSLDIIDFKTIIGSIIKPFPPFKKTMPRKSICQISCDNKGIKKINLSCILHDPSVKTALPNLSAHCDTHPVVITLTNLLESKISNVNKFVYNLDVKAFLNDNPTLLWERTGQWSCA